MEEKDLKPVNVNRLLKFKEQGRKITALTAYDYSTAKILDGAGIDIILVGDSLSMVALGRKNTISVTVDEMIHHSKAVVNGVNSANSRAMTVADMPFMSYQADEKTALINAGRFLKETGVHAVKIEGGYENIQKAARLCYESGIPVMGHLGFTPQSLQRLGGYNVQSKNSEATAEILKQAKALANAGVFAVVLEMMPEESAKIITENLSIPTIGIGAGRFCSGQILVTDDILGKYQDFTPKFARKYADIASVERKAISEFIKDVSSEKFPDDTEVFHLTEEEKIKLMSLR